MAIHQLPARTRWRPRRPREPRGRAAKATSPGLGLPSVYNPTEFVAQSVTRSSKTLFEAMLLVVLVVLVFLQTLAAPGDHPDLAIPVSLVGTFAVMLASASRSTTSPCSASCSPSASSSTTPSWSSRTSSAHLEHGHPAARGGASAMDEVGGAVVAIALVLCAVFVPTAFLGGITGQFYQQFAVTIAGADGDLVRQLADAVAGAGLLILLHAARQGDGAAGISSRGCFSGFNRGFDRVAHGYGPPADSCRHSVMLVSTRRCSVSAGWPSATTPTGFIPAQDRATSSSPCSCRSASLERTDEVSAGTHRARYDGHPFASAAFAGFSTSTPAEQRQCRPCSRCSRTRRSATRRTSPPMRSPNDLRKRLASSRAPSSSSSRRPRSRHRHRRRLQHAADQDRGRAAATDALQSAAATDELVARRAAPG